MPSLHSQLLYMLDEDEPDPARAWELQEARSRGERLPPRVRVPEFLQYGEAARLGAQLRRVYEALPREQVLTLVFDDMRDDTGAVYRRTLAFLGLPDDGRVQFPRVNENKVHRGRGRRPLHPAPPGALVSVARGVKRVAGVERLGVLERVRRGNRQVTRRREIDPDLAAELRDHFRDDVGELGELIGRDLSGWVFLRAAAAPPGGTLDRSRMSGPKEPTRCRPTSSSARSARTAWERSRRTPNASSR